VHVNKSKPCPRRFKRFWNGRFEICSEDDCLESGFSK
jgi:hypothetical protein